LCISIETVEVAFFVTVLETLQILGVEMSTGGSTESNVGSFEAFLTIYLSIITRNLYPPPPGGTAILPEYIILSSNSAVLINIITGVSPPHFDFFVKLLPNI
jgi:hypothetical protein